MDWIKQELDEFKKNKKESDEKKKTIIQESLEKERILRKQIQDIATKIILPTFKEFSALLKIEGYYCQVKPTNVLLLNENLTIIDKISLELTTKKKFPHFHINFSQLGRNMLSFECYSIMNKEPLTGKYEIDKISKVELEILLKNFFSDFLKQL